MITASFLKACSGIVIVYDIDKNDLSIALNDWMDIINKYSDGGPPIFLVGNKLDIVNDEKLSLMDSLMNNLLMSHKIENSFFV